MIDIVVHCLILFLQQLLQVPSDPQEFKELVQGQWWSWDMNQC
jgi:hypothetical protein